MSDEQLIEESTLDYGPEDLPDASLAELLSSLREESVEYDPDKQIVKLPEKLADGKRLRYVPDELLDTLSNPS